MTLLRLEGLSKRFGSTLAVEGFDLAVETGSRTAIVGPSGSGKSTLLRLVAGFETPDSGRIVLDDDVLAEAGRAVPAHLRPIGLVSQDGALFPHLDVGDNIGFGLERRLRDRARRINELMDLVELDRTMLSRRPHELSGGQQQRVALARALARHPRLMLLDEPFSALDAGLRESMRRKVAEVLQSQGIASILVTHDQAEALTFADQLVVLRDGRLQQVGPPRRLYREPKDAATAAFLGPAIVLGAEIEPGGWARCALGRFPVEAAEGAGPASLLVRPEQIELRPLQPAASGGEGTNGVAARVVDVEFAGPLCHVCLVWDDATAPDPSLRVPVASSRAPGVGESVTISLSGTPHLLRG